MTPLYGQELFEESPAYVGEKGDMGDVYGNVGYQDVIRLRGTDVCGLLRCDTFCILSLLMFVITGADPVRGGVLGVRSPSFWDTPKLQKEGETSHMCTQMRHVLVVKSYPGLSEILYPPLVNQGIKCRGYLNKSILSLYSLWLQQYRFMFL